MTPCCLILGKHSWSVLFSSVSLEVWLIFPIPVWNASVLLDIGKTCCCLAKESHTGYKPQFTSWLCYTHMHPVNYSSLHWAMSCFFMAHSAWFFPKHTWHIAGASDLYSNYHFMHFVLFVVGYYFSWRNPVLKHRYTAYVEVWIGKLRITFTNVPGINSGLHKKTLI